MDDQQLVQSLVTGRKGCLGRGQLDVDYLERQLELSHFQMPQLEHVFERQQSGNISNDLVVIEDLRRSHLGGGDLGDGGREVLVESGNLEGTAMVISVLDLHGVLDDLVEQLEAFVLVVDELALQLEVVLLQVFLELEAVVSQSVLCLVFVEVLEQL